MTGVLIGRDHELAALRAVDEREEVAAALVVGDPGSGKSRLLEEAAARSDRHVLRVIGYEPERLVPLAAASDLVRECAEAAFADAVDPVRIFESVHRGLAARAPVLLVVDDVQWIDDLSTALVHYVVRAAMTSGDLHVLAAGRAAARTHALAEDLARLLDAERVTSIALGPLSREEGVHLARSLDSRLAESDAVALSERSGGIPFWIEALVRAGGEAVEAGRLLTARLRDASADAADLLGVLAIVARPSGVEDLAPLVGWPQSRAEAAADELVACGVAVRSRGGVALAHDLIREAAAAELPGRRRRELHQAVASSLEDAGEDDVSLLRAAFAHRVAAGERPFELAAKLLASPQRRLLERHDLDALAALADEADVRTPIGEKLRFGVAALAQELGAHGVALERFSEFAPLATDGGRRFASLLGASQAAFALGWDYAERAHEFVDAALVSAQSDADSVAARAHQARILLWLDHKTEAGAAIARDALERSRALGSEPDERRIRLMAFAAANEACMQEADGEGQFRLGEEMLALAATWNDDDARVDGLQARASGEFLTQPLQLAERSLRTAWELATRRVLPEQAGEAAFGLASVLHDQGRLEESLQILAKAVELAERIPSMRPTRLIAHELAIVRGDVDGGFDRYVAAIDERPDPHVRVIPRFRAALLLARVAGAAARERVVALAGHGLEDAAAARCPRCTNELHVFNAAALALVGCGADAASELATAESVAPLDAYRRYLRLHSRALVTAVTDPAGAAEVLRHVCAETERLERRLELLWARIDLARLLAREERREAAELLRQVASEADVAGALAIVGVAEQELRRLGVRTWRRGRSRVADGTLSDREREIAQLVRTGASNPEIAQALFLSRKTVERHVSNVLAKLGARNRAELAALLAREGEGAPR